MFSLQEVSCIYLKGPKEWYFFVLTEINAKYVVHKPIANQLMFYYIKVLI